jgi:hypothetical protein
MTDLITRARRAAGIAGNDVTGNLLIELVEEIERLRDLAARVIEADDEARQDYGGALMLLAALADELRPAKPATGPKGPDLAARLDRIEKWLTATHGYPYPGKD